MDISHIAQWAIRKGIDIIGTGDFTHPTWLNELRLNLKEDGSGFLKYQKEKVRFVLSAEISSIYKQGGKVRKIHTLVLVPDLKTAIKVHQELAKIGNVFSDGRPILGLSAKDLAKIILDINQKSMIIPAHIWTPWFSVFGSKSGFDSLEECFEEMTPEIFAVETGLSSDPEMNWRVKSLDNITLISNSDAHSGPNLAREANVFELDADKISYSEIYDTLKSKDLPAGKVGKKRFPYTIEFFPEEGKYHFDGHVKCGQVVNPFLKTYKNDLCPICKKPLTIGVANRVEKLATRIESIKKKNFPGTKHIVPLREIIAESFGVGVTSKKVIAEYFSMTDKISELDILLDMSEKDLKNNYLDNIAEGIIRVRAGNIKVDPGYDGVYGKVRIFDHQDIETQKTLF
jgi:uncharacterized protein (TIGR00375 family)